MTAKEKAEELLQKYEDYGWKCEVPKECAIIAVDEIIECLNELYSNPWVSDSSEIEVNTMIEKYERVKQEIENL